MSTYILKQEGEIVTGFDDSTMVQWCTPKKFGCYACISATANGGAVTLTISVHTPVGSFSKSFSFSGNICYTWHPVKKISVTPCIGNFQASAHQICFSLSIKVCVNLFIKKICTPTFSHKFCIPLPKNEAQELLVNDSLSDNEIIQAMLLNYLMESEDKDHGCECNG